MGDEELEAAIKRAYENLMQIKRRNEEIERPYVKVLTDLMALRRTSSVIFLDGNALRVTPINTQGGSDGN